MEMGEIICVSLGLFIWIMTQQSIGCLYNGVLTRLGAENLLKNR